LGAKKEYDFMSMSGETVVILGGYGLVGMQIARMIAKNRNPGKIVIASLFQQEALNAIEELKEEFPELQLECCHGNVFVREEYSQLSRSALLSNEKRIIQLYEDTFGALDPSDPENIYNKCLLVKIIQKYRPDVLIDAINTATGISYQDIKTSSHRVFKFHNGVVNRLQNIDESLLEKAGQGDKAAIDSALTALRELKADYEDRLGVEERSEELNNKLQLHVQLVSQIVPQLVRHVILLYKACREVGTRMYLKIGTTGTGGMGLNIPYTHGEDRPSFKLMAKSSVGFAHSGLLFLLARTPGPTIFKEIKPASLIGYRKVDIREIKKFGQVVNISNPQQEDLTELDYLDTRNPEGFPSEGTLKLPGVDTGENGFFARGEFEAITYLGQMEFITPQEIAEIALHEISGRNTGKDVVQGVAGAVLDPSYRGGFLRPIAINDLDHLERTHDIPSVAIGQLGPPQLTKLLFETHLLTRVHGTISQWVDDKRSDAEIADHLNNELRASGLDKTITSLGIPIRMANGRDVLRGAKINIPESVERRVAIDHADDFDTWTNQGWVDLRPENISCWRARFKRACLARQRNSKEGSAMFSRETYPYDEIRTGEIVGWIFNHEPLLGNESVGGRLW
jgi:hypothetical protein